jgi:hypothetical protein
VTADAFGNVYLSGWTSGALAAPNPTGEPAPFLARFDSNGAAQWVHQENAGHQGVRVAADGQGNVFAPRGSNTNDQPSSMNKYDSAGNLLWSTPIPLGGRVMYGVDVDAAGNAFAPEYVNGQQSVDVVLRMFDGQTGSIVWERTLDTGEGTITSAVSVDGLGGVYIAGHTSGSDIGPNAGPQDVFIAKYTVTGDFVWSRQFGTPAQDVSFSVSADGLGNVYVSGATAGSLGGPNAGGDDHFVVKFSGNGDQQWVRQWGNSGGATNGNVWTDAVGNIYVSGGVDGASGGPHLGTPDLALVKFDSAGNLLWRTQIGTGGMEVNSGGLTGDALGNIYIAGRTSGSWGATNAGGYDAVLIKLSVPPGSGASLSALTALAPQDVSAKPTPHVALTNKPTVDVIRKAASAPPMERTDAPTRRVRVIVDDLQQLDASSGGVDNSTEPYLDLAFADLEG